MLTPHTKKVFLFLSAFGVLMLLIAGGFALLPRREPMLPALDIPSPPPIPSPTEADDRPSLYEVENPAPIVDFHKPGWNVYRNEEYGFEVNYPLDWRIGVSPYEEETQYVSGRIVRERIFGFNPQSSGFIESPIQLEVIEISLKNLLREFGPEVEAKKTILNVNNIDMIKLPSSQYYNCRYLIEKNERVYSFRGFFDNFEPVCENIVNSFRFIE